MRFGLDEGPSCEAKLVGMAGQQAAYQPPSMLEKLESQKFELEARLSKVDEAIAALKSNPETERILTLLSRL